MAKNTVKLDDFERRIVASFACDSSLITILLAIAVGYYVGGGIGAFISGVTTVCLGSSFQNYLYKIEGLKNAPHA